MNVTKRLLPLIAGLGVTACSQGEPLSSPAPASAPARPAAATLSGTRETLLTWGSGPAQLGLRPAAGPALAAGPSALALGPDGACFLLDSVRNQVLRLQPDGTATRFAAPSDAEDVAWGDGALALYSPLRASVLLTDTAGAPLGQLTIPRKLRDVQSIAITSSRTILARNAFQETFVVGSPHAPQALSGILQSKKEGAAFLPDGRGVAVQRTAARTIELLVLGSDAEGRTTVARRIAIASDADAGRLLGTAGFTACLRLERVSQSVSLHVSRELVCLDTRSGETSLHVDLPEPGLYAPRSDTAMGGASPQLAWMHPRSEGLLLTIREATEGRLP